MNRRRIERGFFGCAVLFAVSTAPHAALAAVQISTKTTANMICSGGVCSPTAKKAFLNVSDLAGMLANGDVKVISGSIAMDIDVNAALSWVSTSRLTLDSYRSIAFHKPVEIAGSGALSISTNDGGARGDFVFLGKGHVKFWDTNSSLIINGTGYELIDSIRMLQRRTKKSRGGIFALAKSIDAGRVVYNRAPIPTYGGIFEGLGNTISNLTIDDSADNYVAFFGELSQDSVIRDIGLISADVQGSRDSDQSVGTLVGYTTGTTILNSFATGQAFARPGGQVGGLVGIDLDGTITQSRADVVVSETAGGAVGGLVGKYEGFGSAAVSESYAAGPVLGVDGSVVGGLIGNNIGGTIVNAYATGTVTQLKSALPAGFDPSIWGLSQTINGGYPYLIANPPQ